jgi:hypothetical protein
MSLYVKIYFVNGSRRRIEYRTTREIRLERVDSRMVGTDRGGKMKRAIAGITIGFAAAVAGLAMPGPARAQPAPPSDYENCTEAWNAGAAPLHRGDPGYAPKLDRDNDGIACEQDPR